MGRFRAGALYLGLIAISACAVGGVGTDDESVADPAGADDTDQEGGEELGPSAVLAELDDPTWQSSTPGCAAEQSQCASGCVDLASDPENCGGCERECIYREELDQCYEGTCCIKGCKNGLEECDDERFKVPAPAGTMFLVCRNDNGGVAYVATNTGPPTQPGDVPRCRGWEENGEDAWDHLDYIAQLDCTQTGDKIAVDLSPWEGQYIYVGVHRQPSGTGHNTGVCITAAP